MTAVKPGRTLLVVVWSVMVGFSALVTAFWLVDLVEGWVR